MMTSTLNTTSKNSEVLQWLRRHEFSETVVKNFEGLFAIFFWCVRLCICNDCTCVFSNGHYHYFSLLANLRRRH